MTYRDFANEPVAPMPKNFREMSEAANDPIRFAREVAVYNEQLREAGIPPIYEVLDVPEDRFTVRADLA